MNPQEQVLQQFYGFLKTPELWTTQEHFIYEQYYLEPKEIPAEIKEELILPERLVLGRRIECFFDYYISFLTDEEVLLRNTPIRQGKVTIGEIDFLLRNRVSGQISHVELMYKFYLYDPGISEELQRWIGPNRRDTLCKKLKKLKEQQFPLLFRNETRSLLQEIGADSDTISQKVCFKANLFVPLELRQHSFPLINIDCIQGYWIKASDFIEGNYGQFSFYSPKKADWPIRPEVWSHWYSFREIKKQIDQLLLAERSPLVWMKDQNAKYTRFFIVWW